MEKPSLFERTVRMCLTVIIQRACAHSMFLMTRQPAGSETTCQMIMLSCPTQQATRLQIGAPAHVIGSQQSLPCAEVFNLPQI